MGLKLNFFLDYGHDSSLYSGVFVKDFLFLRDKSQNVSRTYGFKNFGDFVVINTQNWNIVERGAFSSYNWLKYHRLKNLVKRNLQYVEKEFISRKISIWEKILYDTFSEISYDNDILPIFKMKWLPCHNTNGIGPWAVQGHSNVQSWRAMIREVLLIKRMPPWGADSEAQNYKFDRSLSSFQEKILFQWLLLGAKNEEN